MHLIWPNDIICVEFMLWLLWAYVMICSYNISMAAWTYICALYVLSKSVYLWITLDIYQIKMQDGIIIRKGSSMVAITAMNGLFWICSEVWTNKSLHFPAQVNPLACFNDSIMFMGEVGKQCWMCVQQKCY